MPTIDISIDDLMLARQAAQIRIEDIERDLARDEMDMESKLFLEARVRMYRTLEVRLTRFIDSPVKTVQIRT